MNKTIKTTLQVFSILLLTLALFGAFDGTSYIDEKSSVSNDDSSNFQFGIVSSVSACDKGDPLSICYEGP